MAHYRDLLTELRDSHFLQPDGGNLARLEGFLATSLRAAHDQQGAGPVFGQPSETILFSELSSCAVPERMTENLDSHLEGLPKLLSGTIKSNHPRMVKNVVPTPTLSFLSSYLAASIYMGNGVTAEDSGNAALAEIQLSRMYAKLAGYDPEEAGGLFTFGGTGTNLYAFRMGVMAAAPETFLKGVANDLVIVGSRPAHYSHQTATSWLGLGRDNYVMARSLRDQTTDLADLEAVCDEQIRQGKRIACIVGVGGTTSCMGIDDFSALSALIDRLVARHALPYRPHLHADSVIGWAYLHFMTYDFGENPLGFAENVLVRLHAIVDRVATLKFADTFGIDFHKTGYAPYVASMLIARSRKQLAALGRESDMMTPLFHSAVAYNPGKYTLETSRSSATMVATLMSVTALGHEGFQALLGHAQTVAAQVKSYLAQTHPELLVVNPDTAGSDVFIRVYPPGADAAECFDQEVADAQLRGVVTDYNDAFFKHLTEHHAFGSDAIAVSKTSAAFYTEQGAPVVALRFYVLNPFLTAETAIDMVETLVKAKAGFDATRARTSAEALFASHA